MKLFAACSFVAASGGVAMSEKKISVVAPIAMATITAREKNLKDKNNAGSWRVL